MTELRDFFDEETIKLLIKSMSPRSGEELQENNNNLFGWRKYPTKRDDPYRNVFSWIEGKRADDGAEDLWRVHDGIYDLRDFIKKHPGGKFWIETTQGTDITEAFESHHVTNKAEQLLKKYYVRDAKESRNSPFTFKENGFYRTLKRAVQKELPKIPKLCVWRSKFIIDFLLALTFIFAIVAAKFDNIYVAVFAGLVLTHTAICSHNFFHQRDNIRMYYFDLTMMNHNDWRISHALSHHLYTNTINDFEISAIEPVLPYIPHKKTWMQRYGSRLYSLLIYALVYHVSLIQSATYVRKNKLSKIRWSLFVPLLIPLAMILFSNSSIARVFILWQILLISSSFYFGVIGVNAAHHHPDIYHHGDQIRNNRDWGLLQLDAVMDRKEVAGNLVLTLSTFGDHALHHLFPSLDHAQLIYLYPILSKVCKEFDCGFKMTTTLDLVVGQYRQLAKVVPNNNPPDLVFKKYK